MILEGIGAADVADHRLRIAVARLVHDAGEISPALCRVVDAVGPAPKAGLEPSPTAAHSPEDRSSNDNRDDDPGNDAHAVVGLRIALDGILLSEGRARADERHEQSHPKGSQHRALLVWPEPAREHRGSHNERPLLTRLSADHM